ncbi:membrane protein [Streptomyces hygroscopicus subsp. hygroscopicus]|uniref:SHOCT domain-containing protein n=1 Tax=Streptomyces sp. KHY 26 TaxID=3097359 RepID=UPI0024A03C03|nr:SHOCT domain-containing protein [Streptomyces hygroscopicus]GLX51099.1 membrane protein [Streptomyces hygroscopicus subsp. hygroscopicus]
MGTRLYLAYDYPVLGAFLTMLWFALWILWFFLLFRVVFDIFRDDGLGGWAKAGWLAFVVVLPYLGVLVYLIARGAGMGRREVEQAQRRKREFDAYVRETAGGHSSTDELARLSEMRGQGTISEEEFARAKELVLSGHRPGS